MKVKIAVLADERVRNEIETLLNMPMKAKTAWKLAKIVRAIDEHMEPIYTAIKSSRMKHTKDGELDEEAFEKDVSELVTDEVDLDFEKISFSELEGVENIEPRVFLILDWLIAD